MAAAAVRGAATALVAALSTLAVAAAPADGRPPRPTAPAAAPAAREAVVRILSPPGIAGVHAGLLAAFSPAPTAGRELVASTPARDPFGCSAYTPSSSDRPHVAVVRRGNCSFLVKAQLAQKSGAEGLIVVSDNESFFVMGGADSAGNLSTFVLAVQRSVGDALLAQLASGTAQVPVVMSFEPYERGVLDLAEAVLVLFATSLVGIGALVGTSDLRAGSPLAPQQGDRIVEVDNKLALGMCVGGSFMLMVFYFLMNYLIYFIIFGFCLASVLNFVEMGSLWLQYVVPSLRGRTLEVGLASLRVADILAFIPSAALGLSWLLLKDGPAGWLLQDIIGFGFLCWIQRIIRLPNLKVATLLLSIMFFFDIFWVFLSPLLFGHSVMVKVATGGNTGQSVPMLFRIPSFGDPLGGERMLGFGDIVLPGLLVTYLRRYDVLSRRRPFAGYFGPVLVGYFCGLCATLASLMLMHMAQPALLYLVPGTLGTTLVLSSKRKELPLLWHAVPVPSGGGAGAAELGAGDLQAGLTEIAARLNDEGICIRLGSREGFQDKYYCGRWLGVEAIPGSDGRCGPEDGPQCASCARFQASLAPVPAAPVPAVSSGP